MPRDLPDYHAVTTERTVAELGDLAELAARLGSIDTYHRFGVVVFMDDFESGLNSWILTTFGNGAALDLSTTYSRSGQFSARLVGGSNSARSATIQLNRPTPRNGRLGVEFSIFPNGVADEIRIAVRAYDGTNRNEYTILYDFADDELRYQNSAGAFVTFATGVTLYDAARAFHSLKLVIDNDAAVYVRFLLDDAEYSLADIAATPAAFGTDPHVEWGITLISRSAQNDEAYIDDAILTQDEPV